MEKLVKKEAGLPGKAGQAGPAQVTPPALVGLQRRGAAPQPIQCQLAPRPNGKTMVKAKIAKNDEAAMDCAPHTPIIPPLFLKKKVALMTPTLSRSS